LEADSTTAGAPVGAGVKPSHATAAARRRRAARTTRDSVGNRGELHLGPADRIVFWILVGVIHLLSIIPDFILYPIGVFGGWLAYRLDRRHVRIGLKNLAIAFPDRSEQERQRILHASYINLGRCAAEYVRLGGFFYQRFKRRVTYRNFEQWMEFRARNPGRGIIVLTAHFGNFELLSTAHAMKGNTFSLVHHTQRFAAGDALVSFVRERAGVGIIRKHAAARAVLKTLRAGGMIGIPFDQNAKRSEAVFVPFFGEPAATSSGLARLVQISRAAVVPVFIVREKNQRRHRIEIFPEIVLQHSGDDAADILENTRRFVSVIEDLVRRYPEQFLWTHRRFRTRPRGMAPVYDS